MLLESDASPLAKPDKIVRNGLSRNHSGTEVGIWEIISEVSPLPTDRQSASVRAALLPSRTLNSAHNLHTAWNRRVQHANFRMARRTSKIVRTANASDSEEPIFSKPCSRTGSIEGERQSRLLSVPRGL
jgi:hypothetical protein